MKLKSLFGLTVFILSICSLQAQTFVVDGINYKVTLINSHVEVTSSISKYSGNITIPSSISKNSGSF